ncbi:hypothetical protein D9M71_823770 [compost metagenome]
MHSKTVKFVAWAYLMTGWKRCVPLLMKASLRRWKHNCPMRHTKRCICLLPASLSTRSSVINPRRRRSILQTSGLRWSAIAHAVISWC